MPVLVLTTFDDDANLFGALRAGAAGYLLKDVSSETLVARDPGRDARRVVPAEHRDRPGRRGVRAADGGGRPAAEALVLPLSPREREILALLGTARRTRRSPTGSASPRAR